MLLSYVPRDATLRPQIPPFLERWIHTLFLNWLDKQWDETDVVAPLPPQFNKLWIHLNLKEAWEPTFLAGYSPEPLEPPSHAAMADM